MKKYSKIFCLKQYFQFISSFFILIPFVCIGQNAEESTPTSEDVPVHIESNEMIYSSKEDKAYAIGDAFAYQGDKKIYADELIAEFEELPSSKEGSSAKEIKQIHAKGNVRMQTPAENLTGGHEAIYTISTEEIIVYGRDILLTSEKNILKAHEKLTYDKRKNHASAYGDVELHMTDRILRAPFVEAWFIPSQEKKKREAYSGENPNLALKNAYASGGVIIQTPSYISSSEEAFYDERTEKADLYGNVKISDGKNIFEGPCGQHDGKTEVSKIVPCSLLQKESKIKRKMSTQEGRVHALLYPKNKTKVIHSENDQNRVQ